MQTLTGGGTGNAAAQNPYTFKGGIKDVATGFVHFGARWYNPTTGTWTGQDVLNSPLDPANANRYTYAGDNPINRSDPTGEASTSCTILGIASIGLGAVSLASGVAAIGATGTILGAPAGAALAVVSFASGELSLIYASEAFLFC